MTWDSLKELKKIGNVKMHTALNGDSESIRENARIVAENGCVFVTTESTAAKSAIGAQKIANILTHNAKVTGWPDTKLGDNEND